MEPPWRRSSSQRIPGVIGSRARSAAVRLDSSRLFRSVRYLGRGSKTNYLGKSEREAGVQSVRFVVGDVFLSRADALAQGVTCEGRRGAGIAREFRARYPEMYDEYRKLRRLRELRPGR